MIELNEDQIYASYQAEDWYYNKPSQQIFEITGGPGTGKTTCVRYIIDKLGLKLEEVLFVAYTGKAALILKEKGFLVIDSIEYSIDNIQINIKDLMKSI